MSKIYRESVSEFIRKEFYWQKRILAVQNCWHGKTKYEKVRSNTICLGLVHQPSFVTFNIFLLNHNLYDSLSLFDNLSGCLFPAAAIHWSTSSGSSAGAVFLPLNCHWRLTGTEPPTFPHTPAPGCMQLGDKRGPSRPQTGLRTVMMD